MTRIVSGVHADVQGQLVPNSLPTGKKAEMRLLVDLTNEVQHVGIQEVSLESVKEKSAVDCPDPVYIIIRAAWESVRFSSSIITITKSID